MQRRRAGPARWSQSGQEVASRAAARAGEARCEGPMVETHIGRAHARIESASEVIDAEMEIDRLTLPPIASMGSKAVANARPPLAILSPSCALPPRLDLESRPRRRQTCHDPTQASETANPTPATAYPHWRANSLAGDRRTCGTKE
jgi:hypothetical protein